MQPELPMGRTGMPYLRTRRAVAGDISARALSTNSQPRRAARNNTSTDMDGTANQLEDQAEAARLQYYWRDAMRVARQWRKGQAPLPEGAAVVETANTAIGLYGGQQHTA